MSCTPSKSVRRVLQDVSVNVSGTPSKLHSNSPPKTSNKAFFPIEQRENEGTVRGSFIGRKRTIDEVDGVVSSADIARPVLGERVTTRGNQILVCDDITDAIDDDATLTSGSTVGETRESAVSLQNTSTGKLAFKTPSTSNEQSALDLLAAPRSHISTPASRATAKKHAEMLRIRLKLAMYKVKTNQIYVPMSELQFPPCEWVNSFPESDIPTTSPTPKALPIQQMQSRSNPKLLPAPVLVPTAYSARRITEPYMPSSPPCSALNSDMDTPDSEEGSEDSTSPVTLRNGELLRPPLQLSSPPSSEKSIANTSRIYGAEGGLTSSVVKGRAANGLLELMQS